MANVVRGDKIRPVQRHFVRETGSQYTCSIKNAERFISSRTKNFLYKFDNNKDMKPNL